jgi:hypothetical protein
VLQLHFNFSLRPWRVAVAWGKTPCYARECACARTAQAVFVKNMWALESVDHDGRGRVEPRGRGPPGRRHFHVRARRRAARDWHSLALGAGALLRSGRRGQLRKLHQTDGAQLAAPLGGSQLAKRELLDLLGGQTRVRPRLHLLLLHDERQSAVCIVLLSL